MTSKQKPTPAIMCIYAKNIPVKFHPKLI